MTSHGWIATTFFLTRTIRNHKLTTKTLTTTTTSYITRAGAANLSKRSWAPCPNYHMKTSSSQKVACMIGSSGVVRCSCQGRGSAMIYLKRVGRGNSRSLLGWGLVRRLLAIYRIWDLGFGYRFAIVWSGITVYMNLWTWLGLGRIDLVLFLLARIWIYIFHHQDQNIIYRSHSEMKA